MTQDSPARIRSPRATAALYGAASLLTLLLIWIAATSVFGWIAPRVLPSPFEVVSRFANLLVEPFSGATLGGHILGSLMR